MLAGDSEVRVGVEINLSFITNDREFDEIEDSWKCLVEESQATVYQTFEWQRTWWKYFGNGRNLYSILCRVDDRLVGILPVYFNKSSVLGLRVARSLQFLGTGISDYLEPIVAAGYEEIAVGAFVAHLQSIRKKWDIFEISDVSESSPVSQLLVRLLKESGLYVYSYEGGLCTHVVLPNTWDELLQQVGRHTKHELKRKTEKLKENSQFEVELFGGNEDNVAAAVSAMADLHGERWKSLGYGSAFDDKTNLAFHTEVAEKFAHRGWLTIYFLKINGLRVATSYDFNFKKRIYVYHCNAYGPNEVMKYSPGFVLHYTVMREGIDAGMEVYDMLRGTQSYKATDFKSVQSVNSLIRAVYPSKGRLFRFRLFVIFEFFPKLFQRLDEEFHEVKRFQITQRPSLSAMLKFLSPRLKALFALTGSYFTAFFSQIRIAQKE